MSGSHGQTREERLKAALRDNLRRRKAQARGRTDPVAEEAAGGERDPVDQGTARSPGRRDG